MAKRFRDLIERKPAAWRDSVEARQRELIAAMPLQELRRARQLSQEQLATLRRFVEAMGGQLEITARFPDGAVQITQLQELGSSTK